jgi:hypothetical protein
MKRSGILLVVSALALALTSPSGASRTPSGIQNAGDITIGATVTPNVSCPDCPSGSGTGICYEVTLAANAQQQNTEVIDFHVQVNDANAGNFQCGSVFDVTNNHAATGWTFEHVDQVEGGVNKHYISWYASSGIARGHTFRFCFVYCGSAKRDATLEWIATSDGTNKPGIPDGSGDRNDVPNSGPHDDPGWLSPTGGTGVTDGAGFALASAPTLGPRYLVALLVSLGLAGVLAIRRRRAGLA